MTEVKWHILNPGGREHDGLPCGVCKAEFIEDIGIFVSEIGEKHFGLVDLLPNLLHDAAGIEQGIRSDRLEARVSDSWNVNLSIVTIKPFAKRHHDEARV